jgi:hypothetical protein
MRAVTQRAEAGILASNYKSALIFSWALGSRCGLVRMVIPSFLGIADKLDCHSLGHFSPGDQIKDHGLKKLEKDRLLPHNF